MLARISVVQGDPNKVDNAVATINEKVIPTLKGVEGFMSATFLVERKEGKVVGIAYWANQEALDGSVGAVGPIRTAVADALTGSVVSVEAYEVVAEA